MIYSADVTPRQEFSTQILLATRREREARRLIFDNEQPQSEGFSLSVLCELSV
jgi:hypothetical protein